MQKQNYSFINKTKIKNLALKVSITLLIASVTLCTALYALFRINTWFDTHQFKFVPLIEFHKPIRIEKRLGPLQVAPFNKAKAEELKAVLNLKPGVIWEDYACEEFKKVSANCETMFRISKPESGHTDTSMGWNCHYQVNGKTVSKACKPEDRLKAWSVDCGFWQINVKGQVCPQELFDRYTNLKHAVRKFKLQGYMAWSVCKSISGLPPKVNCK
jgi:hypothetical protein